MFPSVVYFIKVTCFVLLSALFNEGHPTTTVDSYQLDIIHFNDFHDRFEETSPSSSMCAPSGDPCIGGFPRLYTKITEMKAEKPNALVLDAGDSFQGTLWYSIYGWNMTQYFINMLPVDVHTIGNHEFDNTVSGVVPYIKSLNAPVVLANMDDSLEPSIQGTYQKSVIVEKNNRKIGVIGAILQTTNTLSKTGNLKFTNEVEAVKREAKLLAQQGANIIIVLSHCGIEVDRKIAKHGGNLIDIVVGGHSHTFLYNGPTPNGERALDKYPVVIQQRSGNKVLVVQASCYSKYLGNITVWFDDEGKILSWEGLPIYLENSIVQDPKILELMKPFQENTNEIGDEVVGYNTIFLNKTACEYGECNIGNLIMDSFVYGFDDDDVSNDTERTFYNAALISKGGIRTNIDEGNVTYADIVVAQPFFEQVESFDLEGKYIIDAFEYAVGKLSRDGRTFRSNSFLQVSGLKVVFDITKPSGSRVVNAKILTDRDTNTYTDIDPEETYRIATTQFIGNGGDGFAMIPNNKMNSNVEGKSIEVIKSYIKRKSPLAYEVEDRLIFL